MNNVVLGILAHVDAGKTTLSESLLYHAGVISKMGRVDKQDAYLDTFEMEKQRGITIFAKQAELTLEDRPFTLLDTPGHVDFSPEAERVLRVLDYCVLVVSAADGVQSHTKTLWKLCKIYQIPVFIFVNKMDQPGADKGALLSNLKKELSIDCEELGTESFMEVAASANEALLEQYLEVGTLQEEEIKFLIKNRKVFPVLFGSALKDEGVQELISALGTYAMPPEYGEEFGARVYKISRDEKGNRLTHVKITSGKLAIKDVISGRKKQLPKDENLSEEATDSVDADEFENESSKIETWSCKVNDILVLSGEKEKKIQEAKAGDCITLPGLEFTFPGAGLGVEKDEIDDLLSPVLTYAVFYPREVDTQKMLRILREMEEEEPQLHVHYEEHLREIQLQLMGEVQIEIIKAMVLKRYGIPIQLGTGRIMYKETISNVVEGVGHFEPLRHYAEVHLKMEPGEPGSGLVFATDLSEDELSKNWQRLILTHLGERKHKGVLTGSPITDMVITLVAGKAHPKHTEGGDFRQATYRAVRQGLFQAKSVLLEPYYKFKITLPTEKVGRVLNDLSTMHANFEAPSLEGDNSIVEGTAPVATMNGYQSELVAYTGGVGMLECNLWGFAPCHNTEEVVEKIHYQPERDLRNSGASVFCTHGAGYVVEWYDVKDYMHLPPALAGKSAEEIKEEELLRAASQLQANERRREEERKALGVAPLDYEATEKELKDIFEKTYGTIPDKFNQDYIEETKKTRTWNGKTKTTPKPDSYDYEKEAKHKNGGPKPKKEKYLLVDGYNVIFAWPNLRDMVETNIEGARTLLADILCNYQGYTKQNIILVFDAYRIQGHKTEVLPYRNISIVFTKEAETADQYIEKCAHRMKGQADVTVATSDGVEQIIIAGAKAKLLSARDLEKEVQIVEEHLRSEYLEYVKPVKATVKLENLIPRDYNNKES